MTLFSQHLTQLSEAVIAEAKKRGLRLATAESCTAGLVAGCLTEVAGASAVLERGFITYSNESKMQLLGVQAETLAAFGAVSAETAAEMAAGVLKSSPADIAVSVTGIAGPGGGSAEKPVGLVYIAVAGRRGGKTLTLKNLFGGDRTAVRLATVETALVALKKEIECL